MKRWPWFDAPAARFWWAISGFLGACLNVENIGSSDAPELCPEPAQATSAEERRSCIVELIERLASKTWVGTGQSGTLVAQLRFEFGPNGSYRATYTGGSKSAFFEMFVTNETTAAGTYVFTDLIGEEFFGLAERAIGETLTLTGDLEHLTLQGDELVFFLRFPVPPPYATTTRVVLSAER